jgi:4-hydroxy-3-polyprenylbenzoate decarboxylase
MAAVTRAGAIVMPAMPGFYNHPASVDDLVDFMVGKALDHLGVEHHLLRRWGHDPEPAVVPDAPPPGLGRGAGGRP